ncbi:hypothetical protein ABKN59_005293 [Abortiporus biennis]
MFAPTTSARLSGPAIRVARTGTRRVAGVRICQRFQSTTTGTSSSGVSASHIAAGVAGGAAVFLGGYTYYHFSGAKKAVEASKAVKAYYDQTKQTLKDKSPKSTSEALAFLRNITKSYAGVVPGAQGYVDSTFDTLEELHETHGDEVNKILNKTYTDIQAIIEDEKSGMDVETATRISGVLKTTVSELQKISKDVGKDAFSALEGKYPQLAEKLGTGYRELKQMAEKSGPEAKKLYEETSEQLKDILANGFSNESLDKAREFVTKQSGRIREITRKSSQNAWDKAVQQASPYLDKLPDIKQLLSENSTKFVTAGAATVGSSQDEVKEVFEKVKEVAEDQDALKNQEKLEQLKEFVKTKAKEAQDRAGGQVEKGWESLQEWAKTVPGGQEALDKIPEAQAFATLAKERKEDAKNLAKETYDDIFKVLREKSQKAKQLVEETKEKSSRS